MSNKLHSVSIVINTWNRANLLRNTLHSFSWLDYAKFEVVVINGPSTDRTEDVLREFSGKIKVGQCPVANLSMSRNMGIAMAAGEIVAFIDDDAIPEAEWLTQAVEAFDSDDVAAVGGKVFDPTGWNYQYEYSTANRLANAQWRRMQATPELCFPMSYEFPYLQGTNALFRRDVLISIGCFDEEYEYYLDETDVCLRMVDAGYLLRQLPNAYVHHKFAPSNIRGDNKVTKYRYPIIKNKLYFSHVNGRSHYSLSEINADNEAFIVSQLADVDFHIAGGRLSITDRQKLLDDTARARIAAAVATSAPRKFIREELLASARTPFLTFEPLVPRDGRRLVLAFLCQDYPPHHLGGIARFTYDLAVACAAMGHHVHVLTKGEGHHRVDLELGVWVHRIVVSDHPSWPESERLKVPNHIWNHSVTMLMELDRIASHRMIDIVEAPIWDCEGIAPLLSGRYRVVTSLQTTLALSVPDHPEWRADEPFRTNFVEPMVALERFLLDKSYGIHAISGSILDEVKKVYKLNLPVTRVGLARLGIPDWRAIEREANKVFLNPQSGDDFIRVLYVGRLETRKGVDVLLDVIPTITKRYPKVRFILAGDDSIAVSGGESYRRRFEQSHPEIASVAFLGRVSDAELRGLYANCDLFVAPSRFESFGLIYLEAMVFGKPVIGCRVGGVTEVVADGISGILVEPGDANSLSVAIGSLLTDEKLRKEMGYAGRERYERMFTAKRMANDCIAYFRAKLATASNA